MSTVKINRESKIVVRGMEWMDEKGRMRFIVTKPYVKLTRNELDIDDLLNNTAYEIAMDGRYKTGRCTDKIGVELRKIGESMPNIREVIRQRLKKTRAIWKTKMAKAVEIVYLVEQTGDNAIIKEIQKTSY